MENQSNIDNPDNSQSISISDFQALVSTVLNVHDDIQLLLKDIQKIKKRLANNIKQNSIRFDEIEQKLHYVESNTDLIKLVNQRPSFPSVVNQASVPLQSNGSGIKERTEDFGPRPQCFR